MDRDTDFRIVDGIPRPLVSLVVVRVVVIGI